jgi:HK97 family phage major capsid protein
MVKRAIGGTAQFPKLTQSVNRWGVSASWGDEGGQISEDNPSFSRLEVSTGRLTCLSQVSEKELRVNAVGLEAEMTTMFRGAVNDAVSQAILSGSGGNNRPYGINTNTAIASGVVVHARETASQVSYKDLNALQFAVEPGVADEGMYIIKSGANGAMKYIAGLYDTYGRPVLREFFKEGLGTVPTLLGSEYMITPNNTVSLGGRGDVIFGAPQNYALAIDQDISIARSDQYAFNQGLITFRVICYFGGRPLGYSCFAVLGDVSTASSSSSSSST